MSNAISVAGSQSRASSMQKIVGPERRTYSSLFIFSETNPFRRLCRMVSESKVSRIVLVSDGEYAAFFVDQSCFCS